MEHLHRTRILVLVHALLITSLSLSMVLTLPVVH